jgi:hypothetical protein
MIRKRSRQDDWNGDARGGAAPDAPLFNLKEVHERRIHSWSPEIEDELQLEEEEAAQPAVEPALPPPPAAPEPVAEAAPVRPVVVHPAPAPVPAPGAVPAVTVAAVTPPTAAPSAAAAPAVTEKRGRGRPRGRPRRQVHFHVDPDEEVLLMHAVEKYGSQQKGLIAALQALVDIEVVRDEVERLAAECERQRRLLDQAESIFGR